MTPYERFIKMVSVDQDGCWLWTGYVWSNGYGNFTADGQCRAHRWSYQFHNGGIPADGQVDHACHPDDGSCREGSLCKHRRCVNPAHLRIVTARENTLRSDALSAHNAAKTHCKWGHALSGSNLYVTPDGKRRKCVACKLRRTNEWRAKHPNWRSDFYARTGH